MDACVCYSKESWTFSGCWCCYGDGTFYTCPDMFTQLHTLHAMMDNVLFALVFVLLPGKSWGMHTHFYQHIRDACEEQELQSRNTIYRLCDGGESSSWRCLSWKFRLMDERHSSVDYKYCIEKMKLSDNLSTTVLSLIPPESVKMCSWTFGGLVWENQEDYTSCTSESIHHTHITEMNTSLQWS